jgi:hypothetical protein
MIISGTLPNNTVWWISRDGKKVWIESKALENQKFIDKGYNIEKDRIFSSKPRRQIGELTGSRLERRLYKDSWRITLDAFLDIYPTFISEIENKALEEKKKKRQTRTKTESKVPKIHELEKVNEGLEKGNNGELEKVKIDEELKVRAGEQDNKEKTEKSYFDVAQPYVEWIKGEIDKSPNGELKILADEMKEKMGKEYINMHVMRIYFGLKKILPEVGIGVELGGLKGKSALIMKKESRL